MSTVFVRQASYEYATLKPLIHGLLENAGHPPIRSGAVVLVKPNLLAPAPPEKAIVTHPLVVRAVVEYVLEKGGRPQVSDSPLMGSFEKVLRVGGFAEALRGLPVDCRPFKESVSVDVGAPYNRIEIAADALSADLVINLPKLKTHAQMLLTLGVKNTFGCIVGLRKPEWHLRAGVDKEMFAEVLVRVHAGVRPELTVLDGILALEGQGPGSGGTPRRLGVIMASRNAASLDAAVCTMLGLKADDLLTNRCAARSGLLTGDPKIDGVLPSVHGMHLPRMAPLAFGPKRLHRFIRRHLVQRPACDTELCRHCEECWRICPAKAIHPARRGLRFDYDACIRCFCCVEICPHGALAARETPLGRAARRLIR